MTRSFRRRALRAALGVLASAFATTLAGPAAAEAKALTSARDSARRAVTVTIAGEAEASSVEDVLRERIEGASLHVSFEREAAIDSARVLTPTEPKADQLARVWIDLTGKELIFLYVVDGAWERVLGREVQRTHNPEIAWEEVGHIVELAVLALAAGETIGVARSDLVPSAPAAPAPLAPAALGIARAPAEQRRATPPPTPQLRVHGSVFYAMSAYGDGPELTTGPGAMAEVVKRKPRISYGGLIMGELLLPSTVEAASTSIRLTGWAVHALATGGVALGNASELRLDVGAGFELVHAEAHGDGPTAIRLASGGADAVPAGRALVRYALATPLVRFFVGAGADVPMVSTRYLLSRAGQPIVLFEPWVIRPFVLFGFQTP